jgi:membrane associated rhomboid family serine protease
MAFWHRSTGGRTRPIFQERGLHGGRLSEGLLHALISDRGFLRADTRVRGFVGTAAVVEREGACGRLIIAPALGFGRESDLKSLRLLAGLHAAERATTIVVVGGSAEFGRSALEVTKPVRTLHIDDAGAVSEARAAFRSRAPRLVVENALDRLAADLGDGAFPAIDFETARGLVSNEGELAPRSASAIRGVVTTALTVAIVLCFAVQVAITTDSLRGEGAALSVAYRMGAMHQTAILDGDWQRLIGAAFLHFGLLHLAVNGWAQWSLGGPIEFLIGPWRFLALWVGSALGASLTSLLFNEGTVSAGASGAIFGLLGAFTTFVFFRKDVLPQPVPRSLRNGVLATLLLNLAISFIPGIDMAAHAGGFVVGGALAFGLVRARRDRTGPPSARPGPLRMAVLGLVLLGVGLTSALERADLALDIPAIDGIHRVKELSLPVPHGYAVSESLSPGLVTVEADGGPASPYTVTFKVSDPQPDEEAAERRLEGLRPPPAPPVGDAAWIALSRFGIQNQRAIEITVVTPRSGRAQAEKLGAALARLVH